MVIGRITRKVTTAVLIAMLVPAPGLAWQPRTASRTPVDRTVGDRLFAEAMNSVEQSAANLARPQIYILSNVDVPVQPAGSPPLLDAGFVDEVMKGIAAMPEPGPNPQASALAYNQKLAAGLESKVRLITPDQTSTVLMGQVLTRDTYVTQLENTATNIETLLKDPVMLDTVVRGLRTGAAAVDNAYQKMLAAEKNIHDMQFRNSRLNLQGAYEDSMRQAQQLEAKGDAAGAARIRQEAKDTAYGHYVDMRQQFYQALDQNPLLGLGERNTFTPDDFLFKSLRNTLADNAPNSEYVTLARSYLEKGAAEARKEVNRVSAFTTADAFNEFGGAKYERTRSTIAIQGEATGSAFPRELTRAAEGGYEAIAGDKAVTTEIENFGLNLIAGTAWVIPGVGPFISAGTAAIQVVRDGNELWIAVLDAEDARKTAGTTGYMRIITEEDRVAAKKDQLAISMAGLALEGLSHVNIVKGPLKARGAGAATEAAETGAAGARTALAHEAEPPSLPTRKASNAELDARNLEEIQEMDQAYAETVERARAAGVPEERIKQLTAKGGGAGHAGAINAVYLEALRTEGKQIMSVDEFIQASGFETRNKLGTLKEGDYEWLRGKLAEDPYYLDNLPNRGRMSNADGFITPVRQDLLDELFKNPRVGQMAADAKSAAGKAAGAAAAADATGTVIVPPGSTSGAPPPGNPTVKMDPTKTALVDNADTTPTVMVDPNKTAMMDPGSTPLKPPPAAPVVRPNAAAVDRIANDVSESLQKAQQAGQSAQEAARNLRTSLTQLGVSPRQLASALAPKLLSRVATPVSMADVANSATSASGVNVSFEALGVSSGEAFRMTAVNRGTPVQLHGDGVVIEPIMGAPANQPSVINAGAAVAQNVEAFCLERIRPVAPPGTQYRVAPSAVQARHHKLVDVLHAAQRVNALGLLHPDSEVGGYYNFVRQWSIWSKQENFDERTFTEEFLNQTKKNVEAKNIKFTDDMKNTVRKAAPGRWKDINAVLNEANQPKIRAAAIDSRTPFVLTASVVSTDAASTMTLYTRRRDCIGEMS